MAVAENGVLVNGSASKNVSQPTHPAHHARKPSRGVTGWLTSTITR